jgi:c-di-GMP-binding flagellar brake protein YcgR
MFGLKKKRDNRGHPRWMIDRFLAVYDQDKTVFLGRVEDLSEGGMCILSNEIPPSDRHLRLALEVLGSDGAAETFQLRCRLLWVKPEANGELFRIGFEFSGNSPAATAAIAKLIEGQRLTGLPPRPKPG